MHHSKRAGNQHAEEIVIAPVRRSLRRGEWFCIYRWGVSDTHISGITQLLPKEGGYHYIGDQAVVEGTFELKPQWRLPYDLLTEEVAASTATSMPLQREDLVRPSR